MERLTALLLAAHLIGDFALQNDRLATAKSRSIGFLLLHGAIMAAVAYLCLQAWTCWQVPLYVFVTHTLIDAVKRGAGRDTGQAIVLDQACHVGTLTVLAWLLIRLEWLPEFGGRHYRLIVLSGGFIATVLGAGHYIRRFSERLLADTDFDPGGLVDGGRYIGWFERGLIFLLLLVDLPAGIGFLVAAKSILRFGGGRLSRGDGKAEDPRQDLQQVHAEYVLIGTLLSFGLAIALTALTLWAAGF